MKKMILFSIAIAILSACSSDLGSGNPLDSGSGIISAPADDSNTSTSAAE